MIADARLASSPEGHVIASSPEGHMIADILQHYDKQAFPVTDVNRPVHVNMTVKLNQIIGREIYLYAAQTLLFYIHQTHLYICLKLSIDIVKCCRVLQIKCYINASLSCLFFVYLSNTFIIDEGIVL